MFVLGDADYYQCVNPTTKYSLINHYQPCSNRADFNQWLTALASLNGYTVTAADADGLRGEDEDEPSRGAVIDSINDGGVSVFGDDDIQVLYTLLRLVCTEHGHRWMTIDLDPTAAAAVTQNHSVFDNHFSDRCPSTSASYRLHEPSPIAVRAYCHLLTSCCQRIATTASQCNRLARIQGNTSPALIVWGRGVNFRGSDLILICPISMASDIIHCHILSSSDICRVKPRLARDEGFRASSPARSFRGSRIRR